MQIVLNAPQSFENLSSLERENLIQEFQEELMIRSEMIEDFKKLVEDFDDWERIGYNND